MIYVIKTWPLSFLFLCLLSLILSFFSFNVSQSFIKWFCLITLYFCLYCECVSSLFLHADITFFLFSFFLLFFFFFFFKWSIPGASLCLNYRIMTVSHSQSAQEFIFHAKTKSRIFQLVCPSIEDPAVLPFSLHPCNHQGVWWASNWKWINMYPLFSVQMTVCYSSL